MTHDEFQVYLRVERARRKMPWKAFCSVIGANYYSVQSWMATPGSPQSRTCPALKREAILARLGAGNVAHDNGTDTDAA